MTKDSVAHGCVFPWQIWLGCSAFTSDVEKCPRVPRVPRVERFLLFESEVQKISEAGEKVIDNQDPMINTWSCLKNYFWQVYTELFCIFFFRTLVNLDSRKCGTHGESANIQSPLPRWFTARRVPVPLCLSRREWRACGVPVVEGVMGHGYSMVLSSLEFLVLPPKSIDPMILHQGFWGDIYDWGRV